MQYVVFMTAKPARLNANDWVTNAVGRRGKVILIPYNKMGTINDF